MHQKKRVLVFIESALYYRNFVTSGAFNKIASGGHELAFALPYAKESVGVEGIRERLENEGQKVFEFHFDPDRSLRLFSLAELTMVKLRNRSRSFQLKFEKQTLHYSLKMYKFLSFPVIYGLAKKLMLKKIGLNHSIGALLTEFKPDFVFLPTSLVDPLSLDVLQFKKLFHTTKFIMLINGWDNLSSKGTVVIEPDLIGVWGEQSYKHAIEIHNFAKEKIRSMGVPQFETYYRFSSDLAHDERNRFLDSLGLPPNKRYVLFAGSARGFNETDVALELENAINSGQIPSDIHFIYRPHPWRHFREGEHSFFDYTFQHITMDPEQVEAYKASKTSDPTHPKPHNNLPNLDYYPRLLNSVELVMQPCSTMMVESAVMGKPSLIIGFGDGVHAFAPDTMIQFEHFRDILTMEGIELCKNRSDLVIHLTNMLSHSYQPLVEKLKSNIQSIVYKGKDSYADRLFSIVEGK